jgi:hypothetical protein
MKEPAHLTFVKQYLNWERVQERLDRYRHIGRIFPMETLQGCSNKAPYYCHYLSWRLGTWQDEGLFEFFDKLLEIGTALPGWDKTRIPGGCEFDNFWGFVWELQTAVFFADYLGLKTEWEKAGPDFRVSSDSITFFVECTTYRKSFAIEEFIREVFRFIHPQIMVEHVPCLQFSLPKDDKIETFLDELFEPYLDPIFLSSKLREAQQQAPLALPVPQGSQNFYVYLDNGEAVNTNFELLRVLTSSGDPASFLELALKEILGNKTSANKLFENRPNLLMVNFLLGKDWQLARLLRPIPEIDLGETFDGVFLTACGIDHVPSFQNSVISYKSGHPIESLVDNHDKRPSTD